jgi:hypothetical protein
MRREGLEIYVDRRLILLLHRLLEGVRCSRCGRSGNDHFNADHLLEDPEDEKQPSDNEPAID